MDEWINKMWYINTTEYYEALTKEKIPQYDMQMNFESIIPSEISQSQKDKYCVIPLIWSI